MEAFFLQGRKTRPLLLTCSLLEVPNAGIHPCSAPAQNFGPWVRRKGRESSALDGKGFRRGKEQILSSPETWELPQPFARCMTIIKHWPELPWEMQKKPFTQNAARGPGRSAFQVRCGQNPTKSTGLFVAVNWCFKKRGENKTKTPQGHSPAM